MRIRVPLKKARLHLADFTPAAIQFARVIDNPVRALRSKVRMTHKEHGVVRLALRRLTEE